MINTCRKKVATVFYSAVMVLVISVSSSTSIAGGGGGGGGGGTVFSATIQLFSTFIISQYIMTALTRTNLNHDRVPASVTQVPANYTKLILDRYTSIWMITNTTPQIRMLLAKYYYYLVFRYAALSQANNILPGIHRHPNAVTNQVASLQTNQIAVEALHNFVAVINQMDEYRKQQDEYEKLQKVYLFLTLVMLQNPYSPYFLFDMSGQTVSIDYTYAPEVFLAETVTYLLLLNGYNTFIDNLIKTRQQQIRNEKIRRENAAYIAVILLQYMINQRILWGTGK
tara:strand:- start:441 stop:1289 length:849 start_codon:yes stop_codon:yes gene_type:complete